MNKSLLILAAATVAASSASAAVVNVTADITANTFWTADNVYVLDTVIFVKDGAILDIAPGTVVRGQPDQDSLLAGSLVITPTGKIQARGTNTNPVVFTTAALDVNNDGVVDLNVGTGRPQRWSAGNDANFWDKNPKTSPMPVVSTTSTWQGGKNYQMWGGLVITGDAPTNNQNQVESDGVAGITNDDKGFGIVEGLEPFGALASYGGVDTTHNGGVIKYVSIRHGGVGLDPDKEINGLTFYAVGSETTVENVDIYCTSDDGVEIFGGNVNLKNININYADDDGFDVDEGWRGTAQFIFVLQGVVDGLAFGDNGLEIDGEDKSEKQPNIANPGVDIDPLPYGRIYNVTVWQHSASNAARFRAGYAGTIANSIFQRISGSASGLGLRVDGLVTTSTTGNNESEPSARTNFGNGLFQIRNNAVVGFTTGYTTFTANGVSLSNIGVATGTFITGPLPGVAVGSTLYPATLNRYSATLDAMFAGLISAPSHTTTDGINPRPKANASSVLYGTAQDGAYVPTPLVATNYKGAFDRTAPGLWTTGWTALNTRNILAD